MLQAKAAQLAARQVAVPTKATSARAAHKGGRVSGSGPGKRKSVSAPGTGPTKTKAIPAPDGYVCPCFECPTQDVCLWLTAPYRQPDTARRCGHGVPAWLHACCKQAAHFRGVAGPSRPAMCWRHVISDAIPNQHAWTCRFSHLHWLTQRVCRGGRISLAMPKPSSHALARRNRDTNKNKRLFMPEQDGSLKVPPPSDCPSWQPCGLVSPAWQYSWRWQPLQRLPSAL